MQAIAGHGLAVERGSATTMGIYGSQAGMDYCTAVTANRPQVQWSFGGSMHLVAVYGTLKKGFRNHRLLAQSRFVGEALTEPNFTRSEERRVGKECRSRW